MNCVARQLVEVFLITRNEKENLNTPPSPPTLSAEHALLGSRLVGKRVTNEISERQKNLMGTVSSSVCDKNAAGGGSSLMKLCRVLFQDRVASHRVRSAVVSLRRGARRGHVRLQRRLKVASKGSFAHLRWWP